MTNTIEILHEVTRNAKTLRRYAEQPSKVKKHRYERRKVRSFIRLGDWNEDDAN
jgi:hypothetical protein